MQQEHRCSYCDHRHSISLKEVRTNWAFIKCEACGKLSLLKARDAAPVQPPLPRKRPAPPAIAAAISIPNPPPFLASPERATPPLDPPKEAPRRIPVSYGSRLKSIGKRGPVYAGVLIIASGLLILSAQHLRTQAENLAESSLAVIPVAALAPAIAPIAVAASAAPPAQIEPAHTGPAQVEAAQAAAPAPVQSPSTVDISAEKPAFADSPSTGASAAHDFLVEISKESVVLRAGPGTNYRKLGIASSELKLSVLDWRGDWFRVSGVDGGAAAWIRNDLVRRIAAR